MTKFDELVAKLSELFELDKADLDFGIHRIIKTKHAQIAKYLNERLPEKVRTVFGELAQVETGESLAELRREIVNTLGETAFQADSALDPLYANTPLGKRYNAAVEASRSVRSGELAEVEVYSHLYEFFSRYYEEGDFISRRRRTAGRETYAIPYDGEEVVLHWANKDQYYIKSSEDLRDYTFTVPLNPAGDKGRVQFKLTRMDAVQNNNKVSRIFQLDSEAEIQTSDEALVIPFHFAEGKSRKQTEEAEWEQSVLAALPPEWRSRLAVQDTSYTGSGERSILQKHLRNYTKKNTSDYFIHKDLGGFLRRELDFYVKNEVMYLDDVDNRPADYLEKELRKIKAIRAVAHDLIDFLAQFEDFQKRLWLKKKFVVETNWCITLDRVPEALYPEIAANDAQCREWVRIFAINEIEATEGDLLSPAKPGYSEPLTVDFLKANDKLVLDTAFFPAEFRIRLLAGIEDIDAQNDGLLVHSENFQALNLLQERYREQVKCIYIDPPYNTGNDEFPYKDGYQKSSWFSMMHDRARLAAHLMHEQGLFFLQIGDEEEARSRLLLEDVFPERKNSVVARRGIKNVQAQFSDIDRLNQGHDTIHVCAARNGTRVPHLRQRLPNSKPGKWDTFWRGTDRPTMRYELFGQNPDTGQWRWEENRTRQAADNYARYLLHEAREKGLDDWYVENLQAGVDLDFVRLNDEGVVQYYVPPQDFRLVSDNWLDIPASGSETDFAHEKSLVLLRRLIQWNTAPGDWVLDYFVGSGSTCHAAASFGKSRNRRSIGIEMGDYFDSLVLPRMKRFAYSADWKDGKPTSRDTGVSHCFKYIRLESYEDALNNLALEDRSTDLLGLPEDIQDDYLLRYSLDVESRASLLDLARFENPFACTLKVYNPATGEAEPHPVDLPETFNYLLGLRVRTMQMRDGFLVIGGESPAAETVLVIWRNVHEKDNAALEAFVTGTLRINPADTEYAAIYINGDTTLDDPHKKILLTEQVFHELMFDVKEL